MAGTYHPVCPAYCRDPNAWKTQLIGGSCGVLALALVLGAVIWIVRFHARQARPKNPQMVINEEYLQQKKEERKREKKTSNDAAAPDNAEFQSAGLSADPAIVGVRPRSKARLEDSSGAHGAMRPLPPPPAQHRP
ncbi:hypothetical protein LT330_007622 [Penicillium expansum]|nr:hypothetical protein LT330_007622 [Penicillium expansum]